MHRPEHPSQLRPLTRLEVRLALVFVLSVVVGALVTAPAGASELLRPVDTPLEWAGGVEPVEPTVDLRVWVEVDHALLDSERRCRPRCPLRVRRRGRPSTSWSSTPRW